MSNVKEINKIRKTAGLPLLKEEKIKHEAKDDDEEKVDEAKDDDDEEKVDEAKDEEEKEEVDEAKEEDKDDLDEAPKEDKKLTADQVAQMASAHRGTTISVNSTGAWDRFEKVQSAHGTTINRGKGFEQAVAVENDKGTMLYMGPYKLENSESDKEMFMFFADDMLFISRKKLR